MLGVLHKVALGIAPPQMAALFPLRGVVDDPWQRRRLRSWRPLHNRQLHSHADISCTERMRLSLFGLVRSFFFCLQADFHNTRPALYKDQKKR